MKKVLVILILLLLISITVHAYAKQGCCSHHRGVCGCNGSRVICCDGSLSPSCKC